MIIDLEEIKSRYQVWAHDPDSAKADIDALIAEVERLREALGLFSNPEQWILTPGCTVDFYEWQGSGEPWERIAALVEECAED